MQHRRPAIPAGSEASHASDSDDYDGSVPVRLDMAELRRLSELRSAVSLAHIALEWALIVASIATFWRLQYWLLYPVFVVFIGARQHALLMIAHDAAHYRLLRNRTLNDWVGELLLAWPFVVPTIQGYRRNHFPHHRHLNTDDDPDWVRKRTAEWEFPKTRKELAAMLLLDLIGVGFIKFAITAAKFPATSSGPANSNQRAFATARVAFLVVTAVLLTIYGVWLPYLLLWVIPFITWMQLCFHIRSIAEHFAIHDDDSIFPGTRTVIATWFDRTFVLPKNGNYHLEHHLYPSVPFYRLPELHRLLMQRPGYRSRAHFTRGYFGVLRECTTNSKSAQTAHQVGNSLVAK